MSDDVIVNFLEENLVVYINTTEEIINLELTEEVIDVTLTEEILNIDVTEEIIAVTISDAGTQGPAGIKGDIGPQGIQGPRGYPGESGNSASASIIDLELLTDGNFPRGYDVLLDMIANSTLIPSQKYSFSFQTVHSIPGATEEAVRMLNEPKYHFGNFETLVVTAASVNTLELECLSVEFPDDRLFYTIEPYYTFEPTKTYRGEYVHELTRGVIYKRHYPSLDLEFSYDFRNCIAKLFLSPLSNKYMALRDTRFGILDSETEMVIGATYIISSIYQYDDIAYGTIDYTMHGVSEPAIGLIFQALSTEFPTLNGEPTRDTIRHYQEIPFVEQGTMVIDYTSI
jgi:hypothetical protein